VRVSGVLLSAPLVPTPSDSMKMRLLWALFSGYSLAHRVDCVGVGRCVGVLRGDDSASDSSKW
jgi:hypothetical protein